MRDREPVPGVEGVPAQFTRGYGLVFENGTQAIAMALVDRALRWRELAEEYVGAPAPGRGVRAVACDIEATGFVEHIKRHIMSISSPSWN